MKFVIAPDSFKGSLSTQQVIAHTAQAAQKYFPGCEIVALPMADGGEGTAEALLSATGGEMVECQVHDPLMQMRTAQYGIMQDGTAIMEMAQASGLPLVAPSRRNPLKTTTYGTGEMMRDAAQRGAKAIVIGIGGSATNDGGMGMARALGARFLDEDGAELECIGASLGKVCIIDTSALQEFPIPVTVLCDVTNPLTGPTGATHIYGPQKGGTPKRLEVLEKGMLSYQKVCEGAFGQDVSQIPGAGAAGGLGFGLMLFAQAQLKPGIQTILDLMRFDALIQGASLVITGEGRLDGQSVRFGKVPAGIAQRCAKQGVPVAAIVGGIGPEGELFMQMGETTITTTVNAVMDIQYAMENAQDLLQSAADRLFATLRIGYRMHK